MCTKFDILNFSFKGVVEVVFFGDYCTHRSIKILPNVLKPEATYTYKFGDSILSNQPKPELEALYLEFLVIDLHITCCCTFFREHDRNTQQHCQVCCGNYLQHCFSGVLLKKNSCT